MRRLQYEKSNGRRRASQSVAVAYTARLFGDRRRPMRFVGGAMAKGEGFLSFEQRVAAFWTKVNRDGPIPPLHPKMSNCWLWEGATMPTGYGIFTLGGEHGKSRQRQAHRVAFLLYYGRWPQGDIDHKCHVTGCVRIGHLKEATRRENTLNRAVKICVRGHPLKDPNFYYYGNGPHKKRRCKQCVLQRGKAK